MIKLINMNLEGVSFDEQIRKNIEENKEFIDAIAERDKVHIIEEFWDTVQVKIGLMEKLGISLTDINLGYQKHLNKIESRGYLPREK